jgi:hypothetical protein
MTLSLLGAAAPDFDRPLEMLEVCHTRIARQCNTLDRLGRTMAPRRGVLFAGSP